MVKPLIHQVTPLNLIIPPGSTSENIHNENNCHLVKLIHQVTPLQILFLQAYTCRSNAPVLFPLSPHPGYVGTLWAIYGKILLIYTPNAPYPWDFTSSLHPHICLGWGLLQWLCQFLNTIGDCILKKGSPGMIVVLHSLFGQVGVTPPVNGIEQICRCPGDTVKCLQIVP